MTAALEEGEWSASRPAVLYPGKEPVPILQEAGWAPGLVWTGGKSRTHRDSIPDHPAHSQSLYRVSYRAHYNFICNIIICTLTVVWQLERKNNSILFDPLRRRPNCTDTARHDKFCLVLCKAWFSTFVGPRTGKFFFHKTRVRSQQIYP